MYKVVILASTNGTDFQAIIDEVEAGTLKVEISGLFTNRSKCGAVSKAEKAGIPVFSFSAKGKSREIFDAEMIEELQELKVDLIVLVGYMRILSDEFVQAFPNKIINIHPSLLPKFAGGMDTNVHEEVLAAGEKETGCTIHFVDEKLDGGAIICQKSCKIMENETVDSLKEKVQNLEKKWYPRVIQDFADGKI
jgi:formyltetrahydrofolate-dependent phosphoribosylglycinamide formyltransferase